MTLQCMLYKSYYNRQLVHVIIVSKLKFVLVYYNILVATY